MEANKLEQIAKRAYEERNGAHWAHAENKDHWRQLVSNYDAEQKTPGTPDEEAVAKAYDHVNLAEETAEKEAAEAPAARSRSRSAKPANGSAKRSRKR